MCEPIFKLLRKDQTVRWNNDCQVAFGKIKEYLQEPPILMPPCGGTTVNSVLDSPRGVYGVCIGAA